MERADLVIEHGHVITLDAEGRWIPDGTIAVREGRVIAVAPWAETRGRFSAGRVIDASGKYVFPRSGATTVVDYNYAHPRPGLQDVAPGLWSSHRRSSWPTSACSTSVSWPSTASTWTPMTSRSCVVAGPRSATTRPAT
ncbi:MAG: amidohydrolase family protein [Bacillota bacterium]